jgi:hypothetical protein
MKKVILSLVVITAIGMSGCTKQPKVEVVPTTKVAVTQEVKKVEKARMMDIAEIGKGTISISTPSGSSDEGNIPILMTSENDIITQIGYNGTEVDGSKISYLYVDGKLKSKEQISERCQGSIDLQDSDLKVGNHIIEFIQYDTDKEDGKVIMYKISKYESKTI